MVTRKNAHYLPRKQTMEKFRADCIAKPTKKIPTDKVQYNVRWPRFFFSASRSSLQTSYQEVRSLSWVCLLLSCFGNYHVRAFCSFILETRCIQASAKKWLLAFFLLRSPAHQPFFVFGRGGGCGCNVRGVVLVVCAVKG
ncbi:unnamed protein product [Periconia digitata]|uniref:Uncharacterized protein n=1 Tax=Periconia digitata TaxID=1303443 RepID=A0A9W4UB15_9PLEO|nr:unnamed protein product [Periconia digitata]